MAEDRFEQDKTLAQSTVVRDSVPEDAPGTVATPEGDNEFAPDQPLTPTPDGLQTPRGQEPHSEQPIRDAQS